MVSDVTWASFNLRSGEEAQDCHFAMTAASASVGVRHTIERV